MNPPQAKHWQAPKPSLGQMILAAMGRSLAIGFGLSVLVFIVQFIYLLRSQNPNLSLALFARAGQAFFLAWGIAFPICLILASRIWSDRAFTIAGFLATFFGLAILAVFFVRLADDVVEWFHCTPILVELQNQKNQQDLADLADPKKSQEMMRQELAQSEKERDEALQEAKTDQEKQAIRAEYAQAIELRRRDLEKTQAEQKIIAERSLRADTSRRGMVAYFLTSSTSNDPQDAGIGPALWGSIWLGLITVLFAVPVGVGAALYLEEYRTEGWLAKIIQVNINNLAGVPSVVYGILGGFVFVYFFKLLQEAHPGIAASNLLGGGLTLGLLTLPTIIVSSQEAIRAVPTSLRQGAHALGATKWQVTWTIVLPMARPGILTGTILSLSRAIGEAAPLVLFGAQLFVDQNPSLFSRFTALPLQIFNWCDRPAYTVDGPDGPMVIDIWKYNAAVASTVLLMVLLSMNAIAIILRNRAQPKTRY
jgi:phosphate transport system permease protein